MTDFQGRLGSCIWLLSFGKSDGEIRRVRSFFVLGYSSHSANGYKKLLSFSGL